MLLEVQVALLHLSVIGAHSVQAGLTDIHPRLAQERGLLPGKHLCSVSLEIEHTEHPRIGTIQATANTYISLTTELALHAGIVAYLNSQTAPIPSTSRVLALYNHTK